MRKLPRRVVPVCRACRFEEKPPQMTIVTSRHCHSLPFTAAHGLSLPFTTLHLQSLSPFALPFSNCAACSVHRIAIAYYSNREEAASPPVRPQLPYPATPLVVCCQGPWPDPSRRSSSSLSSSSSFSPASIAAVSTVGPRDFFYCVLLSHSI